MLQPKRVRYRRPQDGRGNKGNAHRGTTLAFGSFGIKTMDAKWIDSRQIEAARVAINRYMNREGQVWIRIFPDKPITRKPADVRVGCHVLRLPLVHGTQQRGRPEPRAREVDAGDEP